MIDKLAKLLADAFIKAVKPELSRLIDQEINRVAVKLKSGTEEAIKPATDQIDRVEKMLGVLKMWR